MAIRFSPFDHLADCRVHVYALDWRSLLDEIADPSDNRAAITGRGRGGDYSPPPAQIPACGFPAPGSCRRSNVTGVRRLATHAVPIRRQATPVTCLIRQWVRSMHCHLPSLQPGPFPPPPSAAVHHGFVRAFHRYYEPVRLLACSTAASAPRLPAAARDRRSDCGPDEVSQVPTRSFRA